MLPERYLCEKRRTVRRWADSIRNCRLPQGLRIFKLPVDRIAGLESDIVKVGPEISEMNFRDTGVYGTGWRRRRKKNDRGSCYDIIGKNINAQKAKRMVTGGTGGEARSIPAVCVEMGEWKQSSGSEPDSGSVAVV